MYIGFLILALGASQVRAHGKLLDPKPRVVGQALKSACGQKAFEDQTDSYGNIQQMAQKAGNQPDPTKCNLWLCKGYQFADNSANVHTFSAGQTIDFKVDIKARHTGTANVSVVDTTTNSILGGGPLIYFDDYASNQHTPPANNTAFSVTLPNDLKGCSQPGVCVLQFYWDSPDAKQTYEDCADFVLGAGSGAPAAPESSAASSQSASLPLSSSTSKAAGSQSTTATSSAAAAGAPSGSASSTAKPLSPVASSGASSPCRKGHRRRQRS